jgi:type I site-specific restriction-modification system R (restriction) subunit
VDKPMRGHALMQAIARVNRVFKDKPGGLVVDLPRFRRRAETGACHLYGKWRHQLSEAFALADNALN